MTFTFTVVTSRGAKLRNVLIRPRADHLTLPKHDLHSNGEKLPYRGENMQVE